MATGFPVRRHALVGPVGPLVQADCQGRVSRRAHCQAHEARLEEIAECLVDERVAAFDALPDGRLRVLPEVRDESLEHALADFLERRRGRRSTFLKPSVSTSRSSTSLESDNTTRRNSRQKDRKSTRLNSSHLVI